MKPTLKDARKTISSIKTGRYSRRDELAGLGIISDYLDSLGDVKGTPERDVPGARRARGEIDGDEEIFDIPVVEAAAKRIFAEIEGITSLAQKRWDAVSGTIEDILMQSTHRRPLSSMLGKWRKLFRECLEEAVEETLDDAEEDSKKDQAIENLLERVKALESQADTPAKTEEPPG